MLSLSSGRRYFLYRHHADMRKGFDSLAGLVRTELADPLSGEIFIFLNKRRNQVKLLLWEKDGFSLYYNRLEKGTYELPVIENNTGSIELSARQLLLILEGISLKSVRQRKRFEQGK
jgi:transposase